MSFKIATFTCCVAAAAFFVSGCKKKETASQESAPAAEAPTQTPATASAPVPQVAQQPVNVQASWTESNAALKKRDYEAAAAALLRVQLMAQAQQLGEKQALDNFNRMRDLQKQIADASAAGDASAQRALKMLSDIHQATRRH